MAIGAIFGLLGRQYVVRQEIDANRSVKATVEGDGKVLLTWFNGTAATSIKFSTAAVDGTLLALARVRRIFPSPKVAAVIDGE